MNKLVFTAVLLIVLPISVLSNLTILNSNYINGTVVFEDGETPVVRLPVKMWSINEKKIIYRGKTDTNGEFIVPKVKEKTTLFVGNISVDLVSYNISDKNIPLDLIIVLPEKIITKTEANMADAIYVVPPMLASPELPKIVSP